MPAEFQLDPFQKEAIEWIEKEHSVLISAPTGAGKTLVAEYAVEKALARNEGVIYTAPVKALSNQKFRDFKARFGEERVGILTGDVSINPDAPLIIMTTEIYRNSLFEKSDRIKQAGWVIFDEVHYLDDSERGTVWEEAILFTPPEIRILALSATVPNVRQLSDWIQTIHSRQIAVVEESHRPVPLEFLFQCQGKIIDSMNRLRADGYFNRDDWKLSFREKRRGARPWRAKPNRLDHLIRHLTEKNRLPAIYFVFGRKRAELLAKEAAQFDLLTGLVRNEISALYQKLLERFDLTHEPSAQELKPIVERGIAYHHAGMLPTLKEVIEQLFTSKLIQLIFTTETFALGINMPARSVIFDELEKFYGTRFRNLTTRDFYQMAGRAGRRGMDERGYVYTRIHPNDIPFPEVGRIIHGKPEPIRSQLNQAYATLLNLYRDLGPKLLEIYPRTFHHFSAAGGHSSEKKRREGSGLIERKLALLNEMGYLASGSQTSLPPVQVSFPQSLSGNPETMDPRLKHSGMTGGRLRLPHEGGGGNLTPKGEFAASLFGYELLLAEMHGDGVMDDLNEIKLNILLSGLVYEPRKGDAPAKLRHELERLARGIEHYSRLVYRKESKYRIYPYAKPPHFNLAQAVEAWTSGETFDKLFRLTGADEGELVRHFRMIIQLLKDLTAAPHTSDRLRAAAAKARKLINRGVVDAERQLRA